MQTPRFQAWTAVFLVALFFVPLLYVLSVGPAVWLVNRGISPKPIEAFYQPLAWLAERYSPVEATLTRYIEFWDDHDPAPRPIPH